MNTTYFNFAPTTNQVFFDADGDVIMIPIEEVEADDFSSDTDYEPMDIDYEAWLEFVEPMEGVEFANSSNSEAPAAAPVLEAATPAVDAPAAEAATDTGSEVQWTEEEIWRYLEEVENEDGILDSETFLVPS